MLKTKEITVKITVKKFKMQKANQKMKFKEQEKIFMATRTDLALEQRELCGRCRGIESRTESLGRIEITRTRVLSHDAEKAFKKPMGQYITLAFDRFLPDDQTGELHEAIKSELIKLLPKNNGLVLVAGLGNRAITPDALGPKTADGIFATRHVTDQLQKALGLPALRPVVALQPGVLGQTGMEACEIISAAVKETKPNAVIVIDALAARHWNRLGCTVQLCDSGICPGSGVHNSRAEISRKTLNVPVIAIGVPTVVDADCLFGEPYFKSTDNNRGGKAGEKGTCETHYKQDSGEEYSGEKKQYEKDSQDTENSEPESVKRKNSENENSKHEISKQESGSNEIGKQDTEENEIVGNENGGKAGNSTVGNKTAGHEMHGRESGNIEKNEGNGKGVSGMMVTPREIDTVIEYAAKTVSHAINCALQPQLDPEILMALNY